ncbi:MAG TPA: GNAT family N-acetyltransferase [Acidimicrobiales bacterium]|jgi:phosphinothricin acetyltransferase|nr:GNAT family N-acetyltransferase [Acidimicrobiales bacterium]
MAEFTVREAADADLPAIVDLQNTFLSTTTIEWTDTPHIVLERADWLHRQQSLLNPVLVAIAAGQLVGWCSFSDFRDTTKWPGYRFTVEHTVHVREDQWRNGVGRVLMTRLFESARSLGKHVMVGAVTGENEGSIRFHERLGFVEVARMPQAGAKFGRWLDLVLLQKQLDELALPPAID